MTSRCNSDSIGHLPKFLSLTAELTVPRRSEPSDAPVSGGGLQKQQEASRLVSTSTSNDVDVAEVIDGLCSFIDRRVMPLQHSLHEYFENPRSYFGADGLEAVPVREARRTIRMEAAEAGYYTMFTPEILGGSGLSNRLYFACIDEMAKRYGPGEPAEPLTAEVIANWFSGPGHIWQHASTELSAKVLPALMAGEIHGTFALSEAEAGSDVFNMSTTAVRDGDEWIINGNKQWASWSATADFILVFAVTDNAARAARKGGISVFYVPTDTAGYQFDGPISILGDPGGREATISFDNVRVPETHRFGKEGDGLRMAFLTLTQTRLWLAARSCGEMEWALRTSVAYAKERKTFGVPIAEHGAIQIMIADCATDLFAARSLGLECATRADQGVDTRTETAIAKLFCVNAAMRVFDRAMQIHGGMGLANGTRLFDGWKTARISRITEGTDEIMRRTIAQSVLGPRGFTL